MCIGPSKREREMSGWITKAALTIVVAVAALAVPAHAQLNPFRRSGFDVSDADVALAGAAAAKLYQGEQAVLGDIERWSNAESGNQGTVRLVNIFTHDELPCRRLQHDIKLANVGTPFRYIFDRCRVPSGEWKLL